MIAQELSLSGPPDFMDQAERMRLAETTRMFHRFAAIALPLEAGEDEHAYETFALSVEPTTLPTGFPMYVLSPRLIRDKQHAADLAVVRATPVYSGEHAFGEVDVQTYARRERLICTSRERLMLVCLGFALLRRLD